MVERTQVKKQWEALNNRFRDLCICYVGLLVFATGMALVDVEQRLVLGATLTLSTLAMLAASVYYFWKAAVKVRIAALKVTGAIGVVSLVFAFAYILAFNVTSQEFTNDTGYILIAAPFATAVLYWLVGGIVTGLTSVFGLRDGPKDEEEIIKEVLDEEDDEDE